MGLQRAGVAVPQPPWPIFSLYFKKLCPVSLTPFF